MQVDFARSSQKTEAARPSRPVTAAERALKEWGIAYRVFAGGRIVVNGDLEIPCRSLTELPDLTRVEVNGDFDCSRNSLSSLAGAPQLVKGSFNCGYNNLVSLEGAPEEIGQAFYCRNNFLKNLKGAPQRLGTHFDCSYNELTGLQGGPAQVGGYFDCKHNALTSLSGSGNVKGAFSCDKNPLLASLEGGPPACSFYLADFGEFKSWEDIPENLRESPATRERRAAEREAAADHAVHCAIVLQAPLGVTRPLRLRRPDG